MHAVRLEDEARVRNRGPPPQVQLEFGLQVRFKEQGNHKLKGKFKKKKPPQGGQQRQTESDISGHSLQR